MRAIRSETLMQSVGFGILLTVACRVLGFGRGVILVRLLDSAALGTWALMSNAVQVLGFVFAMGIPSGMSRYVSRFLRSGQGLRALVPVGTVMLLVAAAACGLGVALWPQVGNLLFSSTASRGLVAVTLIAVFATVAFSMIEGTLQGLKLFRANCLLDLLQSAVFLALTVVLFLTWNSSVFVPAWAHLAATALVTLFFATWLYRRLRRITSDDPSPGTVDTTARWQPLIVFSLGTWCAGSLQAFSRAIDRYMLLHMAHSPNESVLDQIGQYFVASKLGQPLSALAGVLAMALLPHAATLWEEKKQDEVQRMIRLATKVAAICMTLCGAVLVLNKEFFLELIAGRSTLFASAVLASVVFTTIVVALHYILRNYLFCREEAWFVTGIWLASLIANIGLNGMLIPRFEVIGAAAATAISSALALLLTMVLACARGLRLDRGTWLAACAPLVLFAPPEPMLVWLTALMALIIGTEGVFTKSEKHLVSLWLARQWSRCGRPKAARSNPPSAVDISNPGMN